MSVYILYVHYSYMEIKLKSELTFNFNLNCLGEFWVIGDRQLSLFIFKIDNGNISIWYYYYNFHTIQLL